MAGGDKQEPEFAFVLERLSRGSLGRNFSFFDIRLSLEPPYFVTFYGSTSFQLRLWRKHLKCVVNVVVTPGDRRSTHHDAAWRLGRSTASEVYRGTWIQGLNVIFL